MRVSLPMMTTGLRHDGARARTAIAEALRLAGDDASVQFEAGNIAAMGGVTDEARAAADTLLAARG